MGCNSNGKWSPCHQEASILLALPVDRGLGYHLDAKLVAVKKPGDACDPCTGVDNEILVAERQGLEKLIVVFFSAMLGFRNILCYSGKS